MFAIGVGIPFLRSGGALFNPAVQFAPNLNCLWYYPGDYTTLSQDSAGTTPVTAVTQPVGRMLDKSGRNNTILQATATARPITNTQGSAQYLTFDGVNSGMGTGAITLDANMDCFIAVRRATAANVVLVAPTVGSGSFFGVIQSGNASGADSGNVGAPTYAANGIALNGGAVGTTRDQLHLAVTVGAWVVVEIRNLNLATGWTTLIIGNYSGFLLNGDIGGIILAPAGTATARQQNRQYLGAKVGLTLP